MLIIMKLLGNSEPFSLHSSVYIAVVNDWQRQRVCALRLSVGLDLNPLEILANTVLPKDLWLALSGHVSIA